MDKVYKYKHGFALIRCQPYHIGHDRLVRDMLENCEIVTVVIGSMQETGTEKNPLPYFTRKKMIQNVYRNSPNYNRLRIIGVKDSYDFSNFGHDIIKAISIERPDSHQPDVFYAGTDRDTTWFKGIIDNFVICSRNTQDFPFLSGNMVRDMIVFKDERWKEFVHPENYSLIEKSFYEGEQA